MAVITGLMLTSFSDSYSLRDFAGFSLRYGDEMRDYLNYDLCLSPTTITAIYSHFLVAR